MSKFHRLEAVGPVARPEKIKIRHLSGWRVKRYTVTVFISKKQIQVQILPLSA